MLTTPKSADALACAISNAAPTSAAHARNIPTPRNSAIRARRSSSRQRRVSYDCLRRSSTPSGGNASTSIRLTAGGRAARGAASIPANFRFTEQPFDLVGRYLYALFQSTATRYRLSARLFCIAVEAAALWAFYALHPVLFMEHVAGPHRFAHVFRPFSNPLELLDRRRDLDYINLRRRGRKLDRKTLPSLELHVYRLPTNALHRAAAMLVRAASEAHRMRSPIGGV